LNLVLTLSSLAALNRKAVKIMIHLADDWLIQGNS